MTGIVLAGGQSRRLGRDKAFEPLGGHPLLEHVLIALSKVAGEIIVVGSDAGALLRQEWPVPFRSLPDERPGRGPLSGMDVGLKQASFPAAWVVGCDMPFLSPALLQHLMGLVEGYDAVVPVVGDRFQALHAVYRPTCLPAVDLLLRQGRARVQDLFSLVRVRLVGEPEIRRYDPDLRSFLNVNTPEDLARAQQVLLEEETKTEIG